MSRPIETEYGVDLLNFRPVPDLDPRQMAEYSQDSLRVQDAGTFDPAEVLAILAESEGQQVVGVDIGGDKAEAIPYVVEGGLLVPDRSFNSLLIKQAANGANYLTFLETVGLEAARHNIPVGISSMGIINGTTLVDYADLGNFTRPFANLYGSDYALLLPTVEDANNDAEAALKRAAVQVKLQYPDVVNTILEIDGGGLGGAALVGKRLKKMEPGHVEDVRNPFGITEPCGMGGATFVCIERTGSSGHGVQPTWEKLTGQRLDGRQISKIYQDGTKAAGDLYDYSASVMAHTVVGIGNELGMMRNQGDTAVAFHGGGWRVPGFQERVSHILAKDRGYRLPTVYTDKFSRNAGAEGAALSALAKRVKRN